MSEVCLEDGGLYNFIVLDYASNGIVSHFDAVVLCSSQNSIAAMHCAHILFDSAAPAERDFQGAAQRKLIMEGNNQWWQFQGKKYCQVGMKIRR